MRTRKYLNLILPFFNTKRTKDIFRVNPTVIPVREEANEIHVFIYDYTAGSLHEDKSGTVEICYPYKANAHNTWINIDGIRKKDVEAVCNYYEVHPLLIEDILSVNQRAKMDEVNGVLFCLLNMLYYNDKTGEVEQEQISIVLGERFLISFQEDASRDVFNAVRDKLRIHNSKIRQNQIDYLCYALIDMIVDHYFIVMDKVGERIEALEEEIIRNANTRSLAKINTLRKELIVLKRNISPVRDLVSNIIKSESDLLEERTTKYFKDVHDHILQATDLVENYRDMMMNLQDLYLNNVNLKTNEVMKVMAIVTCLLAPATVIGGIFGMNFDAIPYAHHQWGFYLAVSLMLLIPIWMLATFRKRGWF